MYLNSLNFFCYYKTFLDIVFQAYSKQRLILLALCAFSLEIIVYRIDFLF